MMFNFLKSVGELASKETRVNIERRAHSQDSNRDPMSELETVNVRIQNVQMEDQGFYLCIVANAPNAFRSTNAFLRVLPVLKDEQTPPFLASFLQSWAPIIVVFLLFLIVISLLVRLCCSRPTQLNSKTKKGDPVPDIDSIIEKTMSSMKKVCLCLLSLISFYINSNKKSLYKRTSLMSQCQTTVQTMDKFVSRLSFQPMT